MLRWWGPAYDTPTTQLAMGPLQGTSMAALPGGELLVLVDGGAGARNTMWRLPALAMGGTSLGPIAADDRLVVLAPRAAGAIAAIAGAEGACELVPLATDGTPASSIPLPVAGVCARVAVADLGAGRVLAAYVSGPTGAEEASYQVVDLAGPSLGEVISLGRAQPTNIEALFDSTRGAARVLWQDPTALVGLVVSAAGVPGERHCVVDAAGSTMTDYGSFEAAQRPGFTAVVFAGGTRGDIRIAEMAGP